MKKTIHSILRLAVIVLGALWCEIEAVQSEDRVVARGASDEAIQTFPRRELDCFAIAPNDEKIATIGSAPHDICAGGAGRICTLRPSVRSTGGLRIT